MMITLHFTLASAGTLLSEERECPAWDTEEYEVLRDTVSSFLTNSGWELFTQSLLRILLTFIESKGDPLTLKPPTSHQSLSTPVGTPCMPTPPTLTPSTAPSSDCLSFDGEVIQHCNLKSDNERELLQSFSRDSTHKSVLTPE